jgi:hypothetical protein
VGRGTQDAENLESKPSLTRLVVSIMNGREKFIL